MKNSKIFRVAIVGLGRIGVTLEDDPLRIKPCSHTGAWKSLKSVDIVSGCDINPQKREFFKKRWKINNVYSDYNLMLEKEKPDILSVATWTDSHEKIVLTAAKYPSVKAILCEKPIAVNTTQAKRMIETCKKENILLAINHERRFEDRYRLCKNLIEKGFCGEIRTVIGHVLTNVPYKQKSFKVDRSSLMHDGTHLFDIINYLFGFPVWVEGHILKKRKEVVTAIMRLENNVNVFVETGGLRNYFSFELDIQGTDGRIIIGNTIFKLYKKRPSKYYTGFYDLEEIKVPNYKKKNCFITEAEEIINWIKNKKDFPSTGEDGLIALKIIEKISISALLNGKRIYL